MKDCLSDRLPYLMIYDLLNSVVSFSWPIALIRPHSLCKWKPEGRGDGSCAAPGLLEFFPGCPCRDLGREKVIKYSSSTHLLCRKLRKNERSVWPRGAPQENLHYLSNKEDELNILQPKYTLRTQGQGRVDTFFLSIDHSQVISTNKVKNVRQSKDISPLTTVWEPYFSIT